MSSRYDRRDPGTDPAYCDPLSEPSDAPTDSRLADAIDPVSDAAQKIHVALGELLAVTVRHSTAADARRMFDLARALRERLELVINLAGDQMNTLPEHSF